jgi:hypothetical protein
MRERKVVWGVFAGLALVYLSMSPLSVMIMGYMPEYVLAAEQLIHNIGHLIGLNPTSTAISFPRHGMIEVLFELPGVVIGNLLGGSWSDRLLSLEPVLATAGICALLFVWARRVTESDRWAYTLTLVAAFSTMLWPYAYIGMETTQSFFLMLTAYLVLGGHARSKRRTLGVALGAAVAVSVKVTGTFLVPAVAFLVYYYCRARESGEDRPLWVKVNWTRFAAMGSVVIAVFLGNHYFQMRSAALVGWGGVVGLFKGFRTTPLAGALNVVSLLGSANKGLLVYCPVLLLALLALPLAWKEDRRVVSFALLALGGIVASMSTTFYWSDEVWGPRYLLATVAPLVLCLALAKRHVDFGWRRMIPLGVCAALGLGTTFLGVFFWYHSLHVAAMQSQQITIEELQYYPEWNPILFDGQLLRLWIEDQVLGGDADQLWPPEGHTWWVPMGNGPPPPAFHPLQVRLRSFATPQPFLFSSWRRWQTKSDIICWLACCLSLAVGIALLIRTGLGAFGIRKTLRATAS